MLVFSVLVFSDCSTVCLPIQEEKDEKKKKRAVLIVNYEV